LKAVGNHRPIHSADDLLRLRVSGEGVRCRLSRRLPLREFSLVGLL